MQNTQINLNISQRVMGNASWESGEGGDDEDDDGEDEEDEDEGGDDEGEGQFLEPQVTMVEGEPDEQGGLAWALVAPTGALLTDSSSQTEPMMVDTATQTPCGPGLSIGTQATTLWGSVWAGP